ncbi:DMT family transporter [Actinomadura citrea]|uniref:Drug/metabolite transporter (DMT)-like permease n=1 Tax=Actinomadura citrea TaxID=46158 RepID=A0A7Y9KD55_9ACTN|nr:DMT family transporter [Actinomadura citrea]NYE13060.1 drug/metabolite transporter (DMT)-like permease [Actinomadura citrea]GGT88730.1 peptide ABC transporter ATP-binding protein [Actinomadura citrea]
MKPGTPIPPPPADTDEPGVPARGRGDRRWTRGGAALAPALFVVLWSSAFVAGVPGVKAAPPLLLMFARFAVAGVLLAAYALVTRARWPRGRALAHVAVTGLLIQAVQFGCFYTALSLHYPAAVISLVQGLNPVVIALAARLLGETVTRRQALGFALGAAGVVLAVADRVSLSAWGIPLCLAGLGGLSLGTLYQKRFVPDMDVRTGTATQVLVSAAAVGPLSLALETPRVSDWTAFGGSVAWMVLVNSIAAFLLLNSMLSRSSATRVSTVFFLTPSVTAVLAWLVTGQALHSLVIAGLVLGGAGVLLAAGRPDAADPPRHAGLRAARGGADAGRAARVSRPRVSGSRSP